MDILQMSISAGILIAAIVIIRAIALNRVPKSTFLVLWGVAILRLFVPISVSSHFSLYSVIAEVLRYVSPKSLTMGTGNMSSDLNSSKYFSVRKSISPAALAMSSGV